MREDESLYCRDVTLDEERNIDIQVRNMCTQRMSHGIQMYIRFRPAIMRAGGASGANQRMMTKEQLEIMTQAAIQEGLWAIHRL